MKRLFATLLTDVRLQYRNGFYTVTAIIVLFWALVFSQLPELELAGLLPALVLGNLTISTFYFIGGLVLLEKGESSLEAQVVTPLRSGEYLASKVISLAGLSLVENLILVAIIAGFSFRLLPLVLGIAATASLYCLVGFIAVARYDSINEYLFPSVLFTFTFGLPLLPYFGILPVSWLFYLHPLQAPLVMLKGAFQSLPAWEWAYGLLYSALWIAWFFRFSRRTFQRFVVARAGVR